MKRNLLYYGALGMIMSIPAYATLETDQLPTSKAYTDAQLNTVQDAFAGLGENKLMTYPTTAGGTPGSRDIVTTLGTPNASGDYTNTTDTTVATRGAINTGLSNKQDTLHGTSGYAVLGTGTAGTLSEKAIYGTGTQFEDALIETGTLNQAVIDAVNSELTLVNENGQPDSNGTLWKIADSLTLLTIANPVIDMLNALVNTRGTGKCFKLLATGSVDAGTCTSTPSKCGDWGATFEYNNETVQISGISACSTVDEGLSRGDVATNQSQIDTDYTTTGNTAPNTNPPGKYCYCKMETAAGEPAESRWVFRNSYSSSFECASNCTSHCAHYVRNRSDFKSAVFGSVQ